MLDWRCVRRATGERRTIRGSRVDRVQIVLSQETRTELEIVVQIERPPSFEPGTERSYRGSFRQLPHTLDTTKLTLGILSSHLRTSPGAASMVVIRRLQMSGGTVVSGLVVLLVLSVEKS